MEAEKKPFFRMPKLAGKDKLAIAVFLIFLLLMALPVYLPKGDCEIARPGYKCASSVEVMIENCDYWGGFNCITSADPSLPQIEWYIGNLCELAKKHRQLDCSNLKSACNQVTGTNVCPIGV